MKLQEIPEISLLNPGYLLQSFHLPDTRLAADLERLTEKASTMVWAIARYVLIAVAALVVGAVINAVVRNGVTWADFFNPVFYRFLIEYGSLRWQNPFDSGFYMLLSLYGAFHVAALSVARILSLIFSVRVRSILYLSVSIVGFLAMIYLLNPRDAPVQSLIPDVASLIRATAATMIL